MRIVMVTKNVPWPANSGEKMRSQGIARSLQQLGQVTIVAGTDHHDSIDQAAREGFDVRSSPVKRGLARAALRAVRAGSITSGKYADGTLRNMVSDALTTNPDIVVVEHVQLVGLLPPRYSASHLHLDMHNLESRLTRRLADESTGLRRLVVRGEAAALRRMERRAAQKFDSLSVVSETDKVALKEVSDRDDVIVVPNAIEAALDRAPLPSAPAVCFVGLMSWAPNAQAAVWFKSHVWPLVKNAVPTAKLFIVGREPAPPVTALASDDVVVTGTVESVGEWYAKSSVAVAPLLAGGGSRLKILEALSHGRPVVATTVGAEGLEDLGDECVRRADAPDELARAVAELLLDPAECEAAGEAGAGRVRDLFSWPVASRELLNRLRAE